MKPYINTYDDILTLLDEQVAGVKWDTFYQKRERQTPFITQNTLPDENLVTFLNCKPPIRTALELGCGEGRNAIYMAKQQIAVTACDLSETAITNAKSKMDEADVTVHFICQNIFTLSLKEPVDFIYDSGMFHHLAPHRRITYLELLDRCLKPGGYFGLTCFAWGTGSADDIDDWMYYTKPFNAGIAFTKERLRDFFGQHFQILELRRYQNGIPNTIQGLDFMWTGLFQKR